MSFSIGIVGLPNVGKSTLFKALTKKQVLIANYPFATIDPNIGVIEVPDDRLHKIATVTKSAKVIPAAIEFFDIAGLVKNAHKGEGLGNQFLSHIRQTAAILHLARMFEDPEVPHVAGHNAVKDDIEIINLELCMADLNIIEKRLKEETPSIKLHLSLEKKRRLELLQLFKQKLEKGEPIRSIYLTEDDKRLIKDIQLLTIKPIIYVFNVGEINELLFKSNDELKTVFNLQDGAIIVVNAKIEAELADLTDEEAIEYRKVYGIKESGLEKIIKISYQALDLITFFTFNDKETRAWPIKQGTKAVQAAGMIHTDFENKFIKAEVLRWQDLVEYGQAGCRQNGLVRTEGKDYIIKDGDICYFHINPF